MKNKIKKKFNIAILTICFVVPTVNAAPVLWLGDSSGQLGTVDIATGSVNLIGNMGTTMTDIAFDPNGNLWGITFNSLYKIDKMTATSTFVGNLGTSVNSLVFDSSGTLYTANSSLYTINTTTGTASLIGNGGASYSSSGDLAFIGGDLFLSSTGGDSLIKLDTNNGSGALIGNIGFSGVFGLTSPNGIDLFGMSGVNVLSINPLSGNGTSILDYSGQGLGTAFGAAFTEAAVVPVPAAVWLFGSGLIALLGLNKPIVKVKKS